MAKPSRRRMRALEQWKLQRVRSCKNRKAASTLTSKRSEQITEDVFSASKVLLAEESYQIADNLVPTQSELTEKNANRESEMSQNAENENLQASEGINCREIENIENFLTLPHEEVDKDSTIFDGLALMSDAELMDLLGMEDFSFNNTDNKGLVADNENGGLVSMIPMEDGERESMMAEQNEGTQSTNKNDENIEMDAETYEEKATSSKNGKTKAKKKGGKKRKGNRKINSAKKTSILEKKAQALLMNLLQEFCGGEYHVRVSRKDLRERAKSMNRADRITDRGVLDTALKSTVGMVMNEKGDKFMRGYKEDTKEMEFWIEGPNGEGSTGWIMQDYANIKEQNIKLQEDNLMIKEENEILLKEKLELAQKTHNEEEKLKKLEKRNQDLENQLRQCRSMLASFNHFTSELVDHYRIN